MVTFSSKDKDTRAPVIDLDNRMPTSGSRHGRTAFPEAIRNQIEIVAIAEDEDFDDYLADDDEDEDLDEDLDDEFDDDDFDDDDFDDDFDDEEF